MTKDQNKTIKEEIEKKITIILNETPIGSEQRQAIKDLISQTLQRFIEETRLETKYRKDEVFRKCPYCGELVEVGSIYNQTIIELNQKQQQWLKENL